MAAERYHRSTLVAGAIPALLGAGIMLESLSYGMGSLRIIGPGVYPFLLGLTLAGLGVAIALVEARQPDLAFDQKIEWRSLFVIAASVLSFVLTIERFGLAPSAFIGAWIAGWADEGASVRRNTVLGLCIAGFCSFVFVICLRLPIPLFDF